ncbi:hypothetical protein MMC29_000850 [Sticta canariensis]|nr:hypothetical protein [Sticta canariensis]
MDDAARLCLQAVGQAAGQFGKGAAALVDVLGSLGAPAMDCLNAAGRLGSAGSCWQTRILGLDLHSVSHQ